MAAEEARHNSLMIGEASIDDVQSHSSNRMAVHAVVRATPDESATSSARSCLPPLSPSTVAVSICDGPVFGEARRSNERVGAEDGAARSVLHNPLVLTNTAKASMSYNSVREVRGASSEATLSPYKSPYVPRPISSAVTTVTYVPTPVARQSEKSVPDRRVREREPRSPVTPLCSFEPLVPPLRRNVRNVLAVPQRRIIVVFLVVVSFLASTLHFHHVPDVLLFAALF